jgi:hypothetical protein
MQLRQRLGGHTVAQILSTLYTTLTTSPHLYTIRLNHSTHNRNRNRNRMCDSFTRRDHARCYHSRIYVPSTGATAQTISPTTHNRSYGQHSALSTHRAASRSHKPSLPSPVRCQFLPTKQKLTIRVASSRSPCGNSSRARLERSISTVGREESMFETPRC